MKIRRHPLGCLLVAGSVVAAGCSGSSNRVPLPSFNPEASAAQAMELHDADGDGFLAGPELDGAPGLKAAMKNLDADGDGKVSSDDIADRIRAWEDQQIGLMSISCELYMDGQPLSGATVTFEPEEFLGDSIKVAIGETGLAGTFRPKVPKSERPSPDSPPGVQAGLYRVRVSKMRGGSESIPARYNTETTLGQQVSKDDHLIMNKLVRFELKSR